MTIAFEPSKEFVLKAAKTAGRLAKECFEPSARATTDGFELKVRVRFRRKGRPLPTT